PRTRISLSSPPPPPIYTLSLHDALPIYFTSTALGRLTMATGFFPAAVGQSPDPMLPDRPAGSLGPRYTIVWTVPGTGPLRRGRRDRKSTRLNSSHQIISYAVFCLKKKNK